VQGDVKTGSRTSPLVFFLAGMNLHMVTNNSLELTYTKSVIIDVMLSLLSISVMVSSTACKPELLGLSESKVL